MMWLGVHFWYDTHEQLFRMENPWFTQEILTNGNTSLNWKIRVILINFNQYVCWGSCIFESCFLFFKNCTHAFTSLFNLMALCSVLHTLTIGFNEQYDCFPPILLRPANYLDVHLRTQKDLFYYL